MAPINEQKELSKTVNFMYTGNNAEVSNNFLDRNVPVEAIKEFSNTLKAEIIFARNSFGISATTGKGNMISTEQVWKNNLYECQDKYNSETILNGLAKDLYYISEEVSGKKEMYIYDSNSDICFKIPDTIIGTRIVHSVEYAMFIIDGVNSNGIGIIDVETGVMTASDGTKCYEPDLNNFSYRTEIAYYSSDFSSEQTMNIKEFISQGKPSTMQVNGETYTFADYTSTGTKVWANAKTTANGLDAYWVWIPRFAYKLDASVDGKEKTEIIFVDISDNPFDAEKYGETLPEGYVVHEGFKQKNGLKGIWFSKYAPSSIESVPTDQTEPGVPDFTNFDTEGIKLVYYTADGNNSIEEDYIENPAQTIEKDGTTYYWYNYTNKIWANVKTTANGLDAYWVWIPRFAYKLESGTSKVILVDVNNNPLDTETYGTTLPNGYRLHEGFEQKDGLKGIWFSKYAPSSVESVPTDQIEPATPDLSNFKTSKLKLIYYTADGNTSIERDYTEDLEATITVDGKTYYWYDYTNQIWANIKTTDNDLDAYWVWIPRFAYKIESGTSSVILVDENNKPIDTAKYGESLPTGYRLHEGFEQKDGLMGIWFSKYAPSQVETATTEE